MCTPMQRHDLVSHLVGDSYLDGRCPHSAYMCTEVVPKVPPHRWSNAEGVIKAVSSTWAFTASALEKLGTSKL